MFEGNEETANERFRLILGGFTIVRKPVFYLALNILWLLSAFLLCPYLFAMGIVTVYMVPLTADDTLEIFQDMYCFAAIPSLLIISLLTRVSRRLSIKSLRTGVFSYCNELEGMTEIRRKYSAKIRKFHTTLDKILLVFGIAKAFVAPVFNYLTLKDTENEILNPYLPLKTYVPFSTDNPMGFGAAFISQALFFLFLKAIVSVHIEVNMTNAFQFIAQLELLNYSLENIEKRAFLLLGKSKMVIKRDAHSGQEDTKEIQRCLVSCLKENVQHHHAILRLKKVVGPYFEASNSVSTAYFVTLLAVFLNILLQGSSIKVSVLLIVLLVMINYFFASYIGQIISDKSADLKNTLYSSPWPDADTTYHQLLGTMMSNLQNPIIMRATIFRNEMSFDNFSNMTSMAYKVFNLLQ